MTDKFELADACRLYGRQIQYLHPSVNGIHLLWALAGNESSFGANDVPRHEAGYCRGGKYFDKDLTAKYGCWAHCSYGFSQIMFANAARLGFQMPALLAQDLKTQMLATVAMLETPPFHGKLLPEIGRLWNGPAESLQYAADFQGHYALLLPSKETP